MNDRMNDKNCKKAGPALGLRLFVIAMAVLYAVLFLLALQPHDTYAASIEMNRAGAKSLAATDNVSVSVDRREIVLERGEEDFALEVKLADAQSFAGAEFSVRCADSVTIENVAYDKAASKAGPTVSKGVTWFTFFSGTNEFSKPVTATLQMKYSGEENSSAVIDRVNVYTKSGDEISKESILLDIPITILRAGATNTPQTPSTPQVPQAPQTPQSPQVSQSEASKDGKAANEDTSSASGSASSLKTSPDAASAQPPLVRVPNSDTPKTNGNEENPAARQDGTSSSRPTGTFTTYLPWMLVAICVFVIIALWCLLIRKKNSKEQQQ